MPVPVVKVQDVTKSFPIHRPLYKQVLNPFETRSRVLALSQVSFRIEAGEILGIVGPNGAGKTTLLRIIADLIMPDSGKVIISGEETGSRNWKLRRRIGYVPGDERSFFWRLSGRQNIEFFGRLYGLSTNEIRRQSSQMIRTLGIEKKADMLFRGYSAGVRKRFAIVRSFLHKPWILLLDEITNSLDQISAKTVKELVRRYITIRKDCAAVWSTHRQEEISEICDKVIMLDKGKLSSSKQVVKFQQDYALLNDYQLKLKDLDSKYEMFRNSLSPKMIMQSSKQGDVSSFVFRNISSNAFSNIVNVAVKQYGAQIIFAGNMTKDQVGLSSLMDEASKSGN